MGLFQRIFKLGQSEAHSVIDKLEDPIKMTEQGIRDLKKDLEKSLTALAEVKAMHISAKNDLKKNQDLSADYEKKAMLLIQKAEAGSMDAAEADRLATEALKRKEQCDTEVVRLTKDCENFETNIASIDANMKTLRAKIAEYENELKTLKARVKVSQATKKLNKQMANIDSGGTISMLEKMKEKVAQDEALSDSYAEIANESKSLDDEIDGALNDNDVKASNALDALKAKMKGNQ